MFRQIMHARGNEFRVTKFEIRNLKSKSESIGNVGILSTNNLTGGI
jgi:hypothetical protein